MIEINNMKYDNYTTIITWNKFNTKKNNKILTGLAPYISFNINENLLIELEFIITKEVLKNTKLNIKTNVKESLSDIIIKDEHGWDSLLKDKYKCDITRINENIFNINFYVKSYDTNIFINTDIKLF